MKNNLLLKIITSFITIIVVPMILLGSVWYGNLRNTSLKQMKDAGRKEVEAVVEQIELNRLAISNDLIYELYSDKIETYHTYNSPEKTVDIQKDLLSIKNKNPILWSIYLYNANKNYVFDTHKGPTDWDTFYDKTWLDELGNGFGEQVLPSRINLNAELLDGEIKMDGKLYKARQVISVVTPERLGLRLVANIDIQKLGIWLQERFGISDKTIYIASTDELFYSSKTDAKDGETIDLTSWLGEDNYYEFQGKDAIYFAAKIKKTNLYYIEKISMDAVNDRIEELSSYIAIIILVLTSFLVALSVYVSNKLYRPYEDLFVRLQAIEERYDGERKEKEWKDIRKVFKDSEIQAEDENEQDKRGGYESSTMLRMLVYGIVSWEYFTEQMKETLTWNLADVWGRVIICQMPEEYCSNNRLEREKHRLNELINLYLLKHKTGISTETDSNRLTIYLTNHVKTEIGKTEEFLRKLFFELMEQECVFYESEIFSGVEPLVVSYQQCLHRAENEAFFMAYPRRADNSLKASKYIYKESVRYTVPIVKSILIGDEQALQNILQELEKELSEIRKKDYAQNQCARILGEVDREVRLGYVEDERQDIFENIYTTKSFSDLMWYMRDILSGTLELMRHIDKSQEERYYNQAVLYMHKHYKENINITDVADAIGISYVYLSKIFKTYQKDGQRMVDYLNGIRIEEAAVLLEQTNDTLEKIAEQVGYNNVQSLSRFFKKYKGVNPGEYRKNRKKL